MTTLIFYGIFAPIRAWKQNRNSDLESALYLMTPDLDAALAFARRKGEPQYVLDAVKTFLVEARRRHWVISASQTTPAGLNSQFAELGLPLLPEVRQVPQTEYSWRTGEYRVVGYTSVHKPHGLFSLEDLRNHFAQSGIKFEYMTLAEMSAAYPEDYFAAKMLGLDVGPITREMLEASERKKWREQAAARRREREALMGDDYGFGRISRSRTERW